MMLILTGSMLLKDSTVLFCVFLKDHANGDVYHDGVRIE